MFLLFYLHRYELNTCNSRPYSDEIKTHRYMALNYKYLEVPSDNVIAKTRNKAPKARITRDLLRGWNLK